MKICDAANLLGLVNNAAEEVDDVLLWMGMNEVLEIRRRLWNEEETVQT